MKFGKVFLFVMMLLPWISFPLLGREGFRKYWPAALFMSAFISAESYVARKRLWWWIRIRIFPNLIGELPLIVGPFFLGSLWTLKLTYKKFGLFLFANFILNLLFAYPMVNILTKLGIGSLVRFNRFQLMTLFFVKSLILYGSQVFFDQLRKRF